MALYVRHGLLGVQFLCCVSHTNKKSLAISVSHVHRFRAFRNLDDANILPGKLLSFARCLRRWHQKENGAGTASTVSRRARGASLGRGFGRTRAHYRHAGNDDRTAHRRNPALRWGRVNLTQGALRVEETCYYGHFGTPKTQASRREVPLPLTVVASKERR